MIPEKIYLVLSSESPLHPCKTSANHILCAEDSLRSDVERASAVEILLTTVGSSLKLTVSSYANTVPSYSNVLLESYE